MRIVLLAIAILFVALVGVLALEGPAPRARPAAGADVATIAARVESLRDLRFRSRPVPQEVTPAQARRDGLADLDRSYSAAQRGADEEVLKLLGLIEPDVDLRAVSASVYEEGVAGYYDPRSKHLRIVKGTAPGALNDMVIAHELTHALEDQRFGLPSDQGGSDDRLLAALALGEGTAMVVSQEYLQRHIGVEKALATLGAGLPSGPDLPEFLQAQLLFPYTGGMAFVQALRKRAGGSWKLVDLAERLRVPDSTEQVLHPEKWIEVEPPLPVPLDVSLGAGWRRVTSGTFGEWQTGQLLGDAAAAAGWGGDR